MHAIAHVLYTCNVMSAYIACVLPKGILQISRSDSHANVKFKLRYSANVFNNIILLITQSHISIAKISYSLNALIHVTQVHHIHLYN